MGEDGDCTSVQDSIDTDDPKGVLEDAGEPAMANIMVLRPAS